MLDKEGVSNYILFVTHSTIPLPTDLQTSHHIITKQAREIAQLNDQVAQYRRMIFGQKRERHVPSVPEEQMRLDELFEHIGTQTPGFAESKEQISYERRKPKKAHGRKPIPDDLHRERHLVDVSEEQKKCSSCGAQKNHIGDDITEELEYKPAVFFVNQYIKPKYACPCCSEQGVTMASMPPRPIEKGIAGPGLLAYILVSKYVDHLPLYRLQQMFQRYAIYINRSTMAGWIGQLCVYLEAIYEQMYRQLIEESFVIQADETTLKVLDDTVKDKCALGYLWPYVGDQKLVVFEFQDSRSRDGPREFLSGFTGKYLLSDGYAGYNQVIEKNNLLHAMCWAHARRKFFEQKENEPEFIDTVLRLIGKLYDVEREALAADMESAQRYALRNQKSVPVLEKIKETLENPGKIFLPQNKVTQAISYTLNHWQQLNRFLEHGQVPIDNNLVENTIRPVALGRKNWLFAGSPEAAKRMAIIYSLTATCKINGINPYEYFYDILPQVPAHPAGKIADLTPLGWKKRKLIDMG